MISLKEEPTIAEDLCFSPEDSDALDTCRRALTNGGSVVITAAGNESLLAHYTRVLLSQMPGQNTLDRRKLSVRRMPKDKDALLAALNRLLADLDFASVGAKKKVPTAEIWLYELPGPSDSELIVTTAKMIRQFKAAGVSIIINSRQARPGSELLSKLSQRVRGTLVEFALPDKNSCIALAEKVAGTSDALQVNGLIKDLGYTIQKSQSASLSSFPQETPVDLPTQQILTQRNSVKTPPRAPNKISPTADLPSTRSIGRESKKFLLVGGIFVSVAMFGFYAVNENNWVDMQSSASTLYSDLAQSNEVISPVDEISTNRLGKEVKAVAASANAGQTTLAIPEQTVVSKSPEQMAALEESLAETLEPNDSEESLTELILVTPPLPNPSAVYVQHASFRLSQGAYIWKNNAKRLSNAQIFSKGSADSRFVVVSGPFIDRLDAQQYLDSVGVTDKAYFILGDVLGELLVGPNNALASME